MFRILRVAMFLAPKAIVRGNLGVTALTVFMLAIVTMNLLFVPGLIDAIVNSSNKIMIETYSGDLIVESAGENPLISQVRELSDTIATIPGVTGVAARNVIGAEIKFREERIGCNLIGIDPQKDKEVFDIASSLVEGQYLNERDREQILLGMQLAGADRQSIELYSSSLRHVHAGDKVEVRFSNGVQKQYTVKGIFHTGFIQTDIQAFISDLEYQSIVPGARNKASSLRVKLDVGVDTKRVTEQIGALRSDLRVQTWSEMAGIMLSMTDSFRIINQILNVVNILIAGITVFIVTYVDVVNRKRQIGIQRAIGIKPRSIILSYIFRAMFYASLGLILGYCVYRFVIIPLEIRNPFIFPFGPAFLSMSAAQMAKTIIILAVVSLVASFMPVWRVMRKSILDSIWG
jgi:putative ABC transport system permease protein